MYPFSSVRILVFIMRFFFRPFCPTGTIFFSFLFRGFALTRSVSESSTISGSSAFGSDSSISCWLSGDVRDALMTSPVAW